MEEIKTAKLELGGTEYELRATIGAVARVQREAKKLGASLTDMKDVQAEVGGAMIWALMTKDVREAMSPEDVLDLIPVSAFERVVNVAADLISESTPEADEGKPPAKAKAKG